MQLVSLWGDIPYFETSVTAEQLKNMTRTPWREVVDKIMIDLEEAASILPWEASEWGRVVKSVAFGCGSRFFKIDFSLRFIFHSINFALGGV